MHWKELLGILIALMAAQEMLMMLPPGEEGEVDIPDVAFKQGKVRYDITKLVVKRAE